MRFINIDYNKLNQVLDLLAIPDRIDNDPWRWFAVSDLNKLIKFIELATTKRREYLISTQVGYWLIGIQFPFEEEVAFYNLFAQDGERR